MSNNKVLITLFLIVILDILAFSFIKKIIIIIMIILLVYDKN